MIVVEIFVEIVVEIFDHSHVSPSALFSRKHATLHLAVSVGGSVTFLNCEPFSHYCSCPTVRDWIAVYLALFFDMHEIAFPHICIYFT